MGADASGAYDLGIGNSLSGFSFETSNEVSPISFALNGSLNFSAAEPFSGIPEPSGLSLCLLGAGLIGLAVRRLKRVAR
ncbi:MAG: PEP-CTERM sorting domain-containing protein [Bryobacterales bacterium]|nr:PEP-CTERM sorting domain-containing protein [Bryobacterales bacterium]